MSRMARFLGVSGDQEMIEYCIYNASFEKMGGGHPQGNETHSAFLRKGVNGDWKNHFSHDLSRRSWKIAGNLLASLGYQSS